MEEDRIKGLKLGADDYLVKPYSIEELILKIEIFLNRSQKSTDKPALKNYTFGVGYDTDRKYILSTITSISDTMASQQWVYNVFTNKWSRWERNFNCGFVAVSVDKLYMADDTNLLEERKTRAIS